MKLLTVSVSQDIFSFDEVGNKTGEVDIDELQDLIAKIQKMFSADNEKQFLLETEIDRISEKYSAEKDKNDPLVILQKTPKANPNSANTTSIAARLRTHTSYQAHSTQVALTSENDVRVLCSGGVERVCACCMG